MSRSGAVNILVVGGGITGLSLSYYLTRPTATAIRVHLIESRPSLGGWIRTCEQHHTTAGLIRYETGPRSLNRIRGQQTLELCDELGLAESLLPASTASQQRFIVGRDRGLHAVPSSVWSMLRSDLTRSMPAWMIRDLILPAPLPDRDLTMDEFFRARLGPDAADLLASALAAGVYAGDAKKLSMRSCLPSLIETTKQYKSLVRGLAQTAFTRPDHALNQKSPNWKRMEERLGKAPMYSFNGGLTTLIDALEKRLRPMISIETGLKVVNLCPEKLSVQTSDGRQLQFDHIFWTGSTPSLASALSPSSDAVKSLQTSLLQVQYASIVCVTLAWKGELSMNPGFGVLVPSCVPNVDPILGITFDSHTFPTQSAPGTTVMTVMIGGDRNPELTRAPADALIELAQRAVRNLLNIVNEPDFSSVNVALNSIPQFYLGHDDLTHKIRTGAALLQSRFHIMGTAVSGVAINDCIRAGRQASQSLLNSVS